MGALISVLGCQLSQYQSGIKTNPDRLQSLEPATLLSGKASWYGVPFHGRKTANGERYNMYAYTAAHKNLPFGTNLLIINPINNRKLLVRINDRGPYIPGRFLDLSFAAARDLGLLQQGVANVIAFVHLKESALKAPLIVSNKRI